MARPDDGWDRLVRFVRWTTAPIRRMWGSEDPLDSYGLVQMTSVAGDALLAVALADSVFFSVPVGQARTRVVLYLALTMAPLAASAPLLVPLLDRGGYRRAISFGASAGRAVAAAFAAGVLDSLALFPLVFAALVLSRVHGVTRNGLVAAYAGSDEGLVTANARLGRLGAVAGLAAVPGAALLKISGPGSTLGLAAVAYGTAALLVLRLARPEHATERTAGDAEGAVDPRGRLASLAAPAVGVGGLRAAQGFLLLLFAFAVRSGGRPAWWLGAIVGAGVAGTFVGDVLAPRLGRRVREEGVVLVSLAAAGVAAVIAATKGSLAELALLSGVAGIATEAGRLAFQSLMQSRAPAGRHGRVFVRYEVAFQLAWVGGALAPATIPLGVRGGTVALAVGYVATTAIYAVRLTGSRPAASSGG